MLLLILAWDTSAQKRSTGGMWKQNKRKESDTKNLRFAQTQWWLGFKAGANLTEASPIGRFSVFSSTVTSDPAFYYKLYEKYNLVGAQAGLDITFFYQGWSLSFQPNFRRQRFVYTNEYLWLDPENTSNALFLNYEQDHQLDYIEFPLFVKYDILRTPLRPFVQVGAYYATLLNATKQVSVEGTDYASGGVDQFPAEEFSIGADDLFIKSSTGLVGGAGVSYSVGNIRVALDVNYRYGFNNITNAKNRFSENRLAGIGDALDDVKLRNLSISLSCLFPMRYLISKNYKAVD
ncbi:MAG: PorT family protein [Bacteroidia bacterium]|nr:PorT family protein [Bacteroidia bacterium]